MDPTLVPGTRFESQFQICVYEHAILRIYISFFSTIGIKSLYKALDSSRDVTFPHRFIWNY